MFPCGFPSILFEGKSIYTYQTGSSNKIQSHWYYTSAVFGMLDMYAENQISCWCSLNRSVKAGEYSLELECDVSWKVGDVIMITSTSYNPTEGETATIKEINSLNIITLTDRLQHDHVGTYTFKCTIIYILLVLSTVCTCVVNMIKVTSPTRE